MALMAPGMGHTFALQGTRMGPFVLVGMGCCQSLHMPVFAVFRELVMSVFRAFGPVPVFTHIVRLRNAKAIYGKLSLKCGISHFLGGRAPKNAQKNGVLFCTLQFCCFHVWPFGAHHLNLGGWKLSVVRAVNIARNCNIHFVWVASGLLPLAKCVQIPCFIVYSSSLPIVGRGILGANWLL